MRDLALRELFAPFLKLRWRPQRQFLLQPSWIVSCLLATKEKYSDTVLHGQFSRVTGKNRGILRTVRSVFGATELRDKDLTSYSWIPKQGFRRKISGKLTRNLGSLRCLEVESN